MRTEIIVKYIYSTRAIKIDIIIHINNSKIANIS